MVGVEREGGRHKRKSINDHWTREEVPGGVGRCIAQRALDYFWSLVSGVEPVAGHVPVQVEAGEMPAVGLRKRFGQGDRPWRKSWRSQPRASTRSAR